MKTDFNEFEIMQLRTIFLIEGYKAAMLGLPCTDDNKAAMKLKAVRKLLKELGQ